MSVYTAKCKRVRFEKGRLRNGSLVTVKRQ
jgi:hypothetical protein